MKTEMSSKSVSSITWSERQSPGNIIYFWSTQSLVTSCLLFIPFFIRKRLHLSTFCPFSSFPSVLTETVLCLEFRLRGIYKTDIDFIRERPERETTSVSHAFCLHEKLLLGSSMQNHSSHDRLRKKRRDVSCR